MTGYDVPRINPVGLAEYPRDFAAAPRGARSWQRIAAAVILLLFGVTVISTTVVSVGRYCLTSDGGDTRGLPKGWAQGDEP